MNLEQLLGRLKNTSSFMENVTHWETISAREAVYESFPPSLDERIAPGAYFAKAFTRIRRALADPKSMEVPFIPEEK